MRLTGRLNQIGDFPSLPSPGTGMAKKVHVPNKQFYLC